MKTEKIKLEKINFNIDRRLLITLDEKTESLSREMGRPINRTDVIVDALVSYLGWKGLGEK